MNPIKLLLNSNNRELTSQEEEALLIGELSDAYHRDELSMSSRNVQRIAEKVKAMLENESDSEI